MFVKMFHRRNNLLLIEDDTLHWEVHIKDERVVHGEESSSMT